MTVEGKWPLDFDVPEGWERRDGTSRSEAGEGASKETREEGHRAAVKAMVAQGATVFGIDRYEDSKWYWSWAAKNRAQKGNERGDKNNKTGETNKNTAT